MISNFILVLLLIKQIFALPQIRTAPQECPLQDGNLMKTVLFIENATDCQNLCSQEPKCFYYYFYAGKGSSSFNAIDQPSQCFMYDDCIRKVLPATETCPINKENTINVEPFVDDSEQCQKTCSENPQCGYFKYYDQDDEKQPQMCYHLNSCSVRVIREQECPIEPNNYIKHSLFIRTKQACRQECEETSGCRFYYSYPIDYSPAPLFCYLFRSCEGGADERRVALIVSGRHPGLYYVGEKESVDVVRSQVVCEKEVSPNTTEVGRAGAVANYVGDKVMFCGGRDHDDKVRSDCLAYDPLTNEWEESVDMGRSREEAASVVVNNNEFYVMGGFVNDERTLTTDKYTSGSWSFGPDLTEARSRFCAVTTKDGIAILGGETNEALATTDLKIYNLDNEEWVTMAGMSQNRKDHACIAVELDGTKGILVTGGVDENENLLASAEFYSIDDDEWKNVKNMMNGRTEHGMAVIDGMATVIGGVSDDEFLRSIEILDNTSEEDSSIDSMDWRVAAHDLSRPRYDFTVAQIPLSAFPEDEQSLDKCYDLADVIGFI